jgi:hypothetical protein
MVTTRGGLLTSAATVALVGLGMGFGSGGFVDPGLCSIELEEDDFFGAGGAGGGEAPAGEAPAGEAPAGEAPAGEAPAGEAPAAAEWMKSFSAEKGEGEDVSNQEWLAKLGVKDLDGLAKIARDNQRALRESGRVKVPGDGASEGDVKAYREAVGAPLEAAAYAVDMPEAAKGFELDTAFIDPMKAIAHKYHIPAAAFKELGDAFMQAQLESVQGDAASANAERDATIKEWGPTAEQGKEEFRRGLDVLGLKTADAKAIQTGLGAKRTLELFRKIGQMAGEDFFQGNNGRPAERFGVADEASARKQLAGMEADPETRKKLRAKDPVTVARFNGLTEAIAHFRAKAVAAN